ncbi:hypothetical protein B0H13DRAFT_1915834 [Mycena leptocephala]|nr:hypothetical protein B0H13DRAFT_1915834 [Mycena leptocephala]
MAQPLHVAGITCMALAMLMSFLVTISSPPAKGLAMVKSSLKDSQGDLEGFYNAEFRGFCEETRTQGQKQVECKNEAHQPLAVWQSIHLVTIAFIIDIAFVAQVIQEINESLNSAELGVGVTKSVGPSGGFVLSLSTFFLVVGGAIVMFIAHRRRGVGGEKGFPMTTQA